MSDSLVHLLIQIGGVGAVVGAVLLIAKWLLKQISTALNSYVTAYTSAQASIDARNRNLEKLAEEQSRLIRIAETIKDEIAAQAKSRDNRWAFRKEVYCHLIKTTSELISNLSEIGHEHIRQHETEPLEKRRMELTKELMNLVRLAPLATADNVVNALEAAKDKISGAVIDFQSREWQQQTTETIVALEDLLKTFQDSGRKDLWDTTKPEAKAETGESSPRA